MFEQMTSMAPEMLDLASEPVDVAPEMAELDNNVETVAQALLFGMEQMIAQQQQQIQLLAALSQQIQAAMTAPRRIVRDAKGRVVGSQIAA
jgi:hypothetical protein